MITFSLIFSMILPTASGYLFLCTSWTGRKYSRPLILSLSYCTGMGILTQIMLIMSFVKADLSFGGITACLALFSTICAVYVKAVKKTGLRIIDPGKPVAGVKLGRENILLSSGYLALFFFIAATAYYVFWKALNIPEYSWDALNIHSMKAKVFFIEKNMGFLGKTMCPGYPIHVSLMETWAALSQGVWDNQSFKLIFPLFSCAFMVIGYHFLARFTSRTWALLGSILVLSSNMFVLHGTIGYADLCLLAYNCGALMLILLWFSDGDISFLITASLFSGFGAFTKQEGIYYFLIHSFVLLVALMIKRPARISEIVSKFLVFFIPAMSMILFYLLYKYLNNIPLSERGGLEQNPDILSRTVSILKTFGTHMFVSSNWGVIWPLLGVSLAVHFRKISREPEIMLLLISLTSFFALWTAAGIFTQNFNFIGGKDSGFALGRLILHFFPLAPYLIVFLNFQKTTQNSASGASGD